MERRIGGRIDSYIIAFKDDVSLKIRELNTALLSESQQTQVADQLCKQLISFVYDYEKLKLG